MGRPDDPVRDPDRRRSGGPVSRWGDGRFVVEGDGEERLGIRDREDWGEAQRV